MTGRLLLDHAIAGVQHHTTADYLKNLRENEVLNLVREPNNQYDPNAIRVEHNGTKLGYVPATYSGIVAGLLDSGLVSLIAEVGDTVHPKKALCHFRLLLITNNEDSSTEES